jgi:TRAP transporter 4TM/12TM fusion protein
LARWAAIVLPVLTVLVAFTGWFDAVTRRAGHLAIAIPLVFLFYPARKGDSGGVRRFDIALALAAFAAFAWVILDRERIMWRLVYIDPLTGPDLLFSALAIALVLEATRRTLGMTLVIVALAFIAYALAGPVMPGILEHKGVSVTMLLEHLYMVPEGLFNQVTGVMATYLLVFLTFGSLLRVAGGDKIFMDLTLAASGRWVGGPAKAAVVGSTLMGSVSGSTIANVVTTGTVTIPLMKRTGFEPHEAAAVETAAGTGGALMPPVMGAGAFIMAEITGIPLITILKYSLIPALLYFGSLYGYVHVKARKQRMGALQLEGMDRRGEVPPMWRTLVGGAHLLAPLVLLIYLLIQDYSPFLSASSCVLALCLVSYVRPHTRMSLSTLLRGLEATTHGAIGLSATMATAAMIVGVISLTGIMLKTTSVMVTLAGGSILLGIVIVAMIASVLGMGLQITSAYIIVSTLGAPALMELGIPLLTAHLVIFWFAQSATITPPICLTAFVAAQIAEAAPIRTGFESLRVGKALYIVPVMFGFTGLLSGNWSAMIFAGLGGMLFLLMFPVVTMGFYQGPIGTGGRTVGALAGLAFITAALAAGTGAGFTLQSPASLLMCTGAALLVALHVRQKMQGRLATERASPTGQKNTASTTATDSKARGGGP